MSTVNGGSEEPGPQIADRPVAHRYEAHLGGELAGFAAYRLRDNTITFVHTSVQPEFEGHGVGSALARYALDDARRRGLSIVVVCPFIKAWIERHPDYADTTLGDA
ncbi:MAG: GNAT family N-acetyltransferase [Propionibacteriaceae bacterium]